MKKLFVFTASLLLTVVTEAQTINVHKTNGTVVTYPAGEVEYIDFTPKAVNNPGSVPEGVVAVDMGLPSGTKWANMNVGAERPEDYGLYFAWGETVGYGSDISDGHRFNWSSYKWCNGSYDTITKYCTVDDKNVLDLDDDAAYVNWGGSWCMPTDDEIKELLDKTTMVCIILNGVKGLKFTSKTNKNTLFLPFAGYRIDSSLYGQGKYCDYWSALGMNINASSLHIDSGGANRYDHYHNRIRGFPVRPVLRK